MANRYHYTEEVDKLIVEEIKKSPTNLTNAFKAVEKKINIPWKTVAKHYYTHIQKDKSNRLFFTISSKKTSNNYKVTRKGKHSTDYKPENTKKSKWKRILAILAK